MGKMQQQLLATPTQQGITSIGAGLRSAVAGVVSALRPAADVWVHASGHDVDGDGSMGNPFQTLARAFGFIVATPLVGGYTIHLPSGHWQEAVSLPPPNTRIVGQGVGRTWLEGVGGATLTWAEGAADPGKRMLEQLTLVADVSGFDTGDLHLELFRVAAGGVFTLVGRLDMDDCADGSFSNFVNCSNVRVFNPRSTPSTPFSLSYDPLAGTNGPGAVYHQITGGAWSGIAYSSTDGTVPLNVLNADVAGGISASASAVIDTLGTKAASLAANDPSSIVTYSGPIDDASPTFSGLGSFDNEELVLKRTVPVDFGTGNIVIAVPPQVAPSMQNVFATADMPMVDVSWVSNTANSVTLAVAAAAPHPSYELRILVKPS